MIFLVAEKKKKKKTQTAYGNKLQILSRIEVSQNINGVVLVGFYNVLNLLAL
jgi:hypothetical protein